MAICRPGHFDADGNNTKYERAIVKKQRVEMPVSPTFTQPSPIPIIVEDFYLPTYTIML